MDKIRERLKRWAKQGYVDSDDAAREREFKS